MSRSGAFGGKESQFVTAWVEQGAKGLDSETDVLRLFWLSRRLWPLAPSVANFSITWTGSVVAPATGTYVFMGNPINLDVDEGARRKRRQGMVVWVDGKEVLNSAEAGWS